MRDSLMVLATTAHGHLVDARDRSRRCTRSRSRVQSIGVVDAVDRRRWRRRSASRVQTIGMVAPRDRDRGRRRSGWLVHPIGLTRADDPGRGRRQSGSRAQPLRVVDGHDPGGGCARSGSRVAAPEVLGAHGRVAGAGAPGRARTRTLWRTRHRRSVSCPRRPVHENLGVERRPFTAARALVRSSSPPRHRVPIPDAGRTGDREVDIARVIALSFSLSFSHSLGLGSRSSAPCSRRS